MPDIFSTLNLSFNQQYCIEALSRVRKGWSIVRCGVVVVDCQRPSPCRLHCSPSATSSSFGQPNHSITVSPAMNFFLRHVGGLVMWSISRHDLYGRGSWGRREDSFYKLLDGDFRFLKPLRAFRGFQAFCSISFDIYPARFTLHVGPNSLTHRLLILFCLSNKLTRWVCQTVISLFT